MDEGESSPEEFFDDTSEEEGENSDAEVEGRQSPIVADVFYTTPSQGQSPSPVSSASPDQCMIGAELHPLGAFPTKNYMEDTSFPSNRCNKIPRTPGDEKEEEVAGALLTGHIPQQTLMEDLFLKSIIKKGTGARRV